ncbi:N-acetylmuramoyl-L-alanine amidase, partial [Bacteroides thetaiotaomicron]
MRTITLIIIHCSATPEGKALSAEACRQDHIRHRGFRDIGYHFYITRDGEIHPGRP